MTIPSKRIEELEDHLMLFYTGVSRTASDVAKSYVAGIGDRKKQLDSVSALVTDAYKLLTGRGDIRDFGKMLHEYWLQKRSLSTLVSTRTIDSIYEKALSVGAIGGKLMGAGGGGFLLLFVPPARQARVKKEFHKLIHVPFKFEHQGSQIIFYDQQEDYQH